MGSLTGKHPFWLSAWQYTALCAGRQQYSLYWCHKIQIVLITTPLIKQLYINAALSLFNLPSFPLQSPRFNCLINSQAWSELLSELMGNSFLGCAFLQSISFLLSLFRKTIKSFSVPFKDIFALSQKPGSENTDIQALPLQGKETQTYGEVSSHNKKCCYTISLDWLAL